MDTKVYIATDCLKSYPWGDYNEATNLLQPIKPPAPKTQTLTIDQFRQIGVTVDNYLSKQAFQAQDAFSQFQSTILGWISDTRKIYDATTYDVFFGTTESTIGKQSQSIDLTTVRANSSTEEEANRLEAQTIAQFIADLMVEMSDVNRDFNDYGFLRSYSKDDIKIVFNSKYLNKLLKIDMPQIFHKDGLVDKLGEYSLPARYFGRPVTENDIGSGKIIGSDGLYDSTKGTLRAKGEFDYNDKHYFPGDALATSGTYVAVVGGLEASQVYIEDGSIICKIVTKLPPYLSAFEVGTSFYNSRALIETNYLTFGRSTLDYLKNYPFITIKAV